MRNARGLASRFACELAELDQHKPPVVAEPWGCSQEHGIEHWSGRPAASFVVALGLLAVRGLTFEKQSTANTAEDWIQDAGGDFEDAKMSNASRWILVGKGRPLHLLHQPDISTKLPFGTVGTSCKASMVAACEAAWPGPVTCGTH